MINVLNTTKLVVDNSKMVGISKSGIKMLTEAVKANDLLVNEVGWTHYKWPYEELIRILFVFDAVNYCFWAGKGEPKWQINIEGEQIDGSIALLRCIEEEVKRNPDFVNPKYLAKLSESEWQKITRGNVAIPLFRERLACLRELGNAESFETLIQKAKNNATELLESIVFTFPKFNDIANFEGHRVEFYKRAQLLVKGVNDAMVANGKQPLSDIDKLTAFADYKIPQMLRRLRVIEYIPELESKIDNYELIESGSREEVEIRANTIWAVEEIRATLSLKFENVNAAQVDTMLWETSQKKTKDDKPYHRTLTTAY